MATKNGDFYKDYNSIKKKERYIILHSGNELWHLNNVVLNQDTKEITATLDSVNYSHSLYQLSANKTSMRYKASKSDKTFEIHFYINDALQKTMGSQVSIPFSSIVKTNVYQTDTGRVIFSVLGYTVGVAAFILIIIAATKSSCPFVYIKNGETYNFVGELYPGAILPNLIRTDYLPLQDFNSIDNDYELKITNELLEIQHTDLAQLEIVNHPLNCSVLLDQNGNQHSISELNFPTDVVIDDFSSDIKPSLKKDNIIYEFDRQKSQNNNWNTIILKFKNQKSKQAKLVLTAKNSLWFDLLYGKFNEQFGSYFNKFQKEQSKSPAEKSIKWRNEQGIPLSVYIKNNNEWVLIEKINPVGPLAFRDLVIPFNSENIETENIEIKLECGFKFWEVDYAAIDFTKDIDLEKQQINPYSAIDNLGNNVTHLLDKEDNNFLTQPNIGDEVVLKYHINPPKNGEKQSVFLKNRGYYEYIRNYKGIPNFSKLKKFKLEGALSKYSEQEYKKIIENKSLNEIVFSHE
ncbi:hypothetical protein [Flavobacterium sp.]|uniref:hypothetical protein n=1 Tax=Flavobacterium sp. TaxID=239 RepID=UPI003753E43F